jgi:ABC-type oligopeptide transport system substrate-binding subunit
VYPTYYGPLFTADGAANSTGFADAAFDKAWRSYQSATTIDSAKAALWEMESILGSELPYLPLYHPQIAEAYRSDRVRYSLSGILGGIQGRNGGLGDVTRVE